jgi:hypothetical protein
MKEVFQNYIRNQFKGIFTDTQERLGHDIPEELVDYSQEAVERVYYPKNITTMDEIARDLGDRCLVISGISEETDSHTKKLYTSIGKGIYDVLSGPGIVNNRLYRKVKTHFDYIVNVLSGMKYEGLLSDKISPAVSEFRILSLIDTETNPVIKRVMEKELQKRDIQRGPILIS